MRYRARQNSARGVILRLMLILLLAAMGFSLIRSIGYLRRLAGQMALSEATDIVNYAISDVVGEMMLSGQFEYDSLIDMERGENGAVTALKTDMARINMLSSEIMREIVIQTESGGMNISIPLGNLLGITLLSGKGPEIPVEIIMLTSSHSQFRNDFVSAGINQTKHQIILEISVAIDVLVPWDTLSTQVDNEILVAETVIIGSVPENYFNVE